MLYYDYVLTLPDEIAFFWRFGTSWVGRLFLVTRYMCLIGNVPLMIVAYARISDAVRTPFFERFDEES